MYFSASSLTYICYKNIQITGIKYYFWALCENVQNFKKTTTNKTSSNILKALKERPTEGLW